MRIVARPEGPAGHVELVREDEVVRRPVGARLGVDALRGRRVDVVHDVAQRRNLAGAVDAAVVPAGAVAEAGRAHEVDEAAASERTGREWTHIGQSMNRLNSIITSNTRAPMLKKPRLDHMRCGTPSRNSSGLGLCKKSSVSAFFSSHSSACAISSLRKST